MFDKVDKTEDLAEKAKILFEIASTPTVDPERRKKALKLLQEIDPDVKDPLATPGAAPTVYVPRPAPRPSAPPSAAPSSFQEIVNQVRTQDKQKKQSAIDALQGRVGTGTLSEQELRMLLGLCIEANNIACRNKAAAELAKHKQ
jgi:F0F1-type ATP synthase delta subunit